MLRLSTRGCYGVRAMVELALHFGEKPVLMRTIADNQGISRKYLHALLTSLKVAGYVRSVRGAGGGYVLARDPASIRINEVLGVLEGSLCITDCVQDPATCDRSERCVTHNLWLKMSSAIDQLLAEVTLQDLVTEHAANAADSAMYHI